MRRSRTCLCKLTRVVIFFLKRVSVRQEGRVEETRSVRGVRGRNELSAQILPGLRQTASTVQHPQVSSAFLQTETPRSILTFPPVLCGNANLILIFLMWNLLTGSRFTNILKFPHVSLGPIITVRQNRHYRSHRSETAVSVGRMIRRWGRERGWKSE